MKRRLVLSYVTIAALILLALEVPLRVVYARLEHDAAGTVVEHDATALASLADEGLERSGTVDLTTVANRYRTAVSGDVEIVDASGRVVVAPRNPALAVPAVAAAVHSMFGGGPSGIRVVHNLDDLVAFEEVGPTTAPDGAVVVFSPDERVDHRVHDATLALTGVAFVVLGAVALLGLALAESVTRPLTRLAVAARRLGGGDLDARAPASAGPAEVRSLSDEFNGMAGRIQELVTAQEAFVADASHQLRSPLTALRLRVENVAATLPPDDGIAVDVDAVASELDRLSRVIDGLLMLAGKQGERPERAPIDVRAVVADRCDAWAALGEEAGVSLEMLAPTGPAAPAWLVPGHLEQILDNLLANAMDASPDGGSVQVTVSTNGQQTDVHVVDEGRGMAEEDRLHAFDRFWRGAGSRPGTGSGLGLAIVRQLARASGASVELHEATGGGIDATVRLASGPG